MANNERVWPDTDRVRDFYTDAYVERFYPGGINAKLTREGEAEFDRWLAVHDAEVRRGALAEIAEIARRYNKFWIDAPEDAWRFHWDIVATLIADGLWEEEPE